MLNQLTGNRIFISSGEPSGDHYAQFLVRELKKNHPDQIIYGFGGKELHEAGVKLIPGLNQVKTFGLDSAIFTLKKNYYLHHKIARAIYRFRPEVFIAVAYPGMNLLLCSYAKKLGLKVYYFLPPQIWAWANFRKYLIKKWVDEVISVFPFEYNFYKNLGIRVIYLKNPLVNSVKDYKRNDFQTRIGFMPGSRPQQIKKNFNVVIELIKKINQQNQEIQFYLILYDKEIIQDIQIPEYLRVVTENRYQAMKNCDLLIISSGTASLEAGLMSIPQIFFYRASPLDYYIFKKFLRIKEYNLANLYFNNRDVPVFISPNQQYLQKVLYSEVKNRMLI